MVATPTKKPSESPVSVDPGLAVEGKGEGCNGDESYSGKSYRDATNNSRMSVFVIRSLYLDRVTVHDGVSRTAEEE